MSPGDRQLVAALRSELAAVEPTRPCDRAAEQAGFWAGSALGSDPTRGDPLLGRLAVRLGRSAGAPAFDWDGARDHCRMAWLRGRFLASGSLSIANGRTHLEFVVGTDEAPVLAARLAQADLPASWRLRRGRGVVTWKSIEVVGLFLRRAGAGAALLELEARQVSRALRGDLNRVLNADSANLRRVVAAAGRQLAAIEAVEAAGLLARQPAVVREIVAARREAPEATLAELAVRLGVHRSAVQRALDRIELIALHGHAGRRAGKSPSGQVWHDSAHA